MDNVEKFAHISKKQYLCPCVFHGIRLFLGLAVARHSIPFLIIKGPQEENNTSCLWPIFRYIKADTSTGYYVCQCAFTQLANVLSPMRCQYADKYDPYPQGHRIELSLKPHVLLGLHQRGQHRYSASWM